MRLLVVGDLQCDKEQFKAYSIEKNKYDFSHAFADVKELFKEYDEIIANLETPVSKNSEKYVKRDFSFCAPVDFLQEIKNSGINVVTTANNHCLDRGIEGLDETNRLLDEIGIQSLGTRIEKENRYKFLENRGIKVGVLAFTYGTNAFVNQIYLSEEERYKVDLLQKQELSNKFIRSIWNSSKISFRMLRRMMKILHICQFHRLIHEREEEHKNEEEDFKNSIKACKNEGAEVIILLLHIGGQYNEKPTKYTRRICELAKNEGVDIILANHEHVIHPIEFKEGSLIAYSLGNFMSSSGVLRAPFDKMAEYSLGIDIELQKEEGIIQIVSSFIIFKSIYNNEKLKTVSLVDYICKTEKKEELLEDYQSIVNKVLGTKDIVYEVREKIPYKKWEI